MLISTYCDGVLQGIHARPRYPSNMSDVFFDELGTLSVKLVEPLGYLDMVELESSGAVIATDSGGVQKEAFFHRIPCVTLRDETEWVELVEAG